MELQMGPSHPATHGTIKFNLKLDGEVVVDCDVEVGYLHRGFEKMIEQGTWTQAIPYTDRLNYVSPLINNVGFILAVERLCGVEVPPRCQVHPRDHERGLAHLRPPHLPRHGGAGARRRRPSASCMIEARELLWDIIEAVTGARVTDLVHAHRRRHPRLHARHRPSASAPPSSTCARCSATATSC